MESDLQIICNAYDSTWLDVPFTNIPVIDEWLMVIHNRTCITDFIDHGIFPADTPHAVKHQFHLSEEGATCGPFAIMVGEKLSGEEWQVCYHHTGHHGAAVVRRLGCSWASYLVDSSLRSVYEIPATGSSLWGTRHRFYTHQTLPSLPHDTSPIIYVKNDVIFYIPKGHTEPTPLIPRTRRHLVDCSIDAIPRDRNVILLLRDRVAATNRFVVLISFDMQSRTMVFRGHNINETIALAHANGQLRWDRFSHAQEILYSFHEQYPRQLSAGLLRRFARIVWSRMQTDEDQTPWLTANSKLRSLLDQDILGVLGIA